MKILPLVLIGAVALSAGDEKRAAPELPPALRAIVDLARASSPELFADTVAGLVEHGRIPQREARIDLLEQAFAAASGAAEPYRLTAIPATLPDTRALYRDKAGALGLDALSLQSRIVREMLRLDREKARALFDSVARPALEPRPCEDPLVADISAYYEMAAAVAQSTFTAAEKEKSAQVQFLEGILDGARSPGELLPFLRAIKSMDLSPPQRDLLLAAFAEKLESIRPDYRPFAMTFDSLTAQIGTGRPALTAALHDYALAQSRAVRCGPDFGPRIFDSGEEVRPAKIEGGVKADPYFESGDSRQIGDELKALRNLTPSADQFSNRLADFLRDFAAWRPPSEEIDAFHQRATVFRSLLDVVPRGEDQNRVLDLCVSFLATSSAERDHPGEWLYQVKMVLDAPGIDAGRLLGLFRGSGSPGLALLAATKPGT